ncbi:hypothetical protein IC619_010005 [Hazenella sp. IB182353]|uniref:glycosyltransferase n=1 Tax=Polycladospora coralii TaxID=2771432 RepID=UPI0017479A6B|nr:hypothetical protein [Polycladospora coralii]MBS7530822.1 hypothetical protein [Polycladospora coralii]
MTHGKNGLLAEVHSLAEQLTWILDHPQKAKQLALYAYKSLSVHFSWKQVAQHT